VKENGFAKMKHEKLITTEEYNRLTGVKSLETYKCACYKVKDLMKNYRDEFKNDQKLLFNFITVSDYANSLLEKEDI
jgi:hypothetical protein